ncbi:hypothetical protein CFIMG_006763RA [Ceratocystis fimbriata CBS 114723]|uniref:Uncharacterized protein n=1 Tax=Ceratocystis fimbriata CBS 114723 TaxID=1035309 RepID=A0A2C5WPS5_9PEZI|nr:hypothetical protein CFIMG_006763RA [Ceratocystis fimbriata CBS 114723]
MHPQVPLISAPGAAKPPMAWFCDYRDFGARKMPSTMQMF